MSTFPTLSRKPILTLYSEEPIFDGTIRSQFANGSIKTRGGATKSPRLYKLTFPSATLAEKNTLQTFERETVAYGQGSFSWTRPTDKTTQTVKFNKTIIVTQTKKQGLYNVQIELVEII